MGCCCKSTCCARFIERHKATFEKAQEIWLLIQILLYIADIATDGYASYCFYMLGDIYWATLTLCFILLPMIFTSLSLMYADFIKEVDSVISKSLLILVSICFAPLITLIWLMGSVYHSIGHIKLSECILESLPQSCLQLYIIFQYLDDETKVVGVWQYLSLSISILSLGIGIVNCYIFKEIKVIAKAVIFAFGSLNLITRLLICSVFSLFMKPFWLLPMGTFIIISIITWLIKKCYSCSDIPLCKVPLGTGHKCTLGNVTTMLVAWPVTAVFNSFTVSGLPIASASLAYAIGGYFLVPGVLAIVTISLASLSLLANIVIVAVPQFRVIGDAWLTSCETYDLYLVEYVDSEGSFFY